MASSVFKMIHSEKRSKTRDMNDVRTRASKRLKETRKSQRDALLNLHRRVEIQPEVETKRTEQEETLLRLKTYREEKLKRMEEQKKSQKPPFYSLVKVRHTGGTPFRNKQQTMKNLAVTLPPATRSRTAFQKEFVFKATINKIEPNGSKQKDVLPIKSTTIKSRGKNKENQQPIKSKIKMTTKSTAVTTKTPLVRDAPTTVNCKSMNIPVTKRPTRQREVPASTITTRPRRQKEIALDKNNVALSIVNNAQKKKNIIKSKSDLVSKPVTVSDVKKGNGIKPKNLSNSSEQLCSGDVGVSRKVDLKKSEDKSKGEENKTHEVNNLLAEKLAQRVFIMSPLVTSSAVAHSSRRRPRPSTGNLMPSELITENVQVENEKNENKEVQSQPVDEAGSIGPEALRDKLEEETSRLSSMADAWSKRHIEATIPEIIKDEILAVIGQTRLLLSDKFQQFRTLIDNALSEHKEPGVVIKADDLLGFWEMMYLEVEQLNRKYQNLTSLSENGWRPLEKPKIVNKTKKRGNTKKTGASASSKLKEFLKKKKDEAIYYEKELNNSRLQGTPPGTSGKRTPSLIKTINTERKSRRSSASSIMLQKSFLAKAVSSPIIKS